MKRIAVALLLAIMLLAPIYSKPVNTNILASPLPPAQEISSPSYAPGDEVLEKRTRTSKTYWLGGNSYAMDVSLGSIHYQDTLGIWQNINNELTPSISPWDWQMTENVYSVKVKEDITAGQVIEFGKAGESVTLQPMALEWTNDYSQIQLISMPSNGSGVEVSNPEGSGTILWPDSYGTGIDLEWKIGNDRLSKILTIAGLNDLPPPAQYIIDGGNPVLRYNFIFAPSDGVDVYIDGELWNKKTKKQTYDYIEFRKGGEVLWGFAPLIYYDSSNDLEIGMGQSVATVELRGKSLYTYIVIPYEWLQTAVYPVFIDPDVDVRVGASTDDCLVWWDSAAFAFSLTISSVQVGWYNAFQAKVGCGMRFLNVTIPQGAIIVDAHLTIQANGNYAVDTVNSKIRGEDVDSALTFDDYPDFDGRDRTTAEVEWNSIGEWTVDEDYDSPEIKTIIKEIVDREGWESGNDLVIFWDDFEDDSSHETNCRRIGKSYDGSSTYAPKLVVAYTAVAPTVTTIGYSLVEDTTATVSGNITVTGGANATIRGFEWDIDSGAPYANNVHEDGDYGIGVYNLGLTGLPTGDTIYYRAYATGPGGTGYGDEDTFLTKPAAPTDVAATSNIEAHVTITWTKSFGATDYHVFQGAVDLGASGDVDTDNATATAGTITNGGTVTAADGGSLVHVTISLAGEATGVTVYAYTVVASNAAGDSDASAADNGNRSVGAITYQWQRSAADSDAAYGNIAGGTTDPYDDLGGVFAPDGRWYQCVVSATGASNSPQNSVANDRGYMSAGATVITNTADVTSPIDLTAMLNGEITDTGDGDCQEIGFVWDVVSRNDPVDTAPGASAYANNWTEEGAFGIEAFDHLAEGLTELTIYYYRAGAESALGVWSYGDEREFFLGEKGKLYLEFRPDLDETKIRGQGNIPADAVVNNFVGYTLPLYDDAFQMLEFTICIPHRWDGTSMILMHVDYCLSAANESDTVVLWELIYDYATPNVDVIPALPGYTSNTGRYITSDTQYQFYQDYLVLTYLARPDDPMMIDDLLTFKLRREAAGEQLTDTGNVVVFAVDVLFARGDLLGHPGDIVTVGDLDEYITEEDMIDLTIAFEGFNIILTGWAAYFLIGFSLLFLLGLSFLAFWVASGKHLFRRSSPVLFMILAGVAVIFGLYWFDAFTNNLGLAVAILMITYALYCIGMAFRMLFWRDDV